MSRLEKRIKDICVYMTTELSNLEDEEEENSLEISQITKMNAEEVLEHIFMVLQDLVKAKRDFQMLGEYQHYKDQLQYQKALQKLESEVRNHIKIEQQMKLHIETTQAKLEEAQKEKTQTSNSSKPLVDKLRRENAKLLEKVRDLESCTSASSREDRPKFMQELAMLRSIAKKDSSKIMELEKAKHILEQEVLRYKHALDHKSRELEDLTQKCQKLKKSLIHKENYQEAAMLDFYKKKYEEKSEQVRYLEKKLRVGSRLRDTSRNSSRQEGSRSPLTHRSERRTETPFLKSSRSIKKLRDKSTEPRKNGGYSSQPSIFYTSRK